MLIIDAVLLGPPLHSLSAGSVEGFCHNAAHCSFQGRHFEGVIFPPQQQQRIHIYRARAKTQKKKIKKSQRFSEIRFVEKLINAE
jgi:hypothetical protein